MADAVKKKKKLTRKTKGPSPADKTRASEGREPDLDELLKHDLPVFVRNNSEPLGDIHVQFVEQASGRRFPIKIPATTLPINISNRTSKAAINDSIDFRQILEKRMLILVWPKDAMTELRDPDAQEELKELFSSKHAGGGGVSRFSADAAAEDAKADKAKSKKALEDFDISTDDDGFTVDPRVQGVMVQLDESTLDEKRACRKLKNWGKHLTLDDLMYVKQRSGPHKEVRALADKLINAKQNSLSSDGKTSMSNQHEAAVSS